jgi:hypothetical protein
MSNNTNPPALTGQNSNKLFSKSFKGFYVSFKKLFFLTSWQEIFGSANTQYLRINHTFPNNGRIKKNCL